MSMDAVKASRSEKRDHEAKLQRQILDWIEVVKPKRGEVLVMRVPKNLYANSPEEATPEQDEVMRRCMGLVQTIMGDLLRMGIPMAGGTVLREDMKLESVVPPPPPGQPQHHESGLVLPPGTKV